MLDNVLLVQNIKKLCDRKEIKITNLEKELGFGAGIINRWENSADPSFSKIIDIADFFHVTLDELAGRTIMNNNLISKLIQLTKEKAINWGNFSDVNKPTFICDQYFVSLRAEITEVYKIKHGEGYFTIIAQYDLTSNNTMKNKMLQLYAEAKKSKPVLQSNSFNELEELWLLAREKSKGIPDEYKAKSFIDDFLKSYT